MNYIFGNNTFYPRGSRGGSAPGSGGPKQKPWTKSRSTEELPAPPSRWQQLLAFFTRQNAFTDCITAGAGQVTALHRKCVCVCVSEEWIFPHIIIITNSW